MFFAAGPLALRSTVVGGCCAKAAAGEPTLTTKANQVSVDRKRSFARIGCKTLTSCGSPRMPTVIMQRNRLHFNLCIMSAGTQLDRRSRLFLFRFVSPRSAAHRVGASPAGGPSASSRSGSPELDREFAGDREGAISRLAHRAGSLPWPSWSLWCFRHKGTDRPHRRRHLRASPACRRSQRGRYAKVSSSPRLL